MFSSIRYDGIKVRKIKIEGRAEVCQKRSKPNSHFPSRRRFAFQSQIWTCPSFPIGNRFRVRTRTREKEKPILFNAIEKNENPGGEVFDCVR